MAIRGSDVSFEYLPNQPVLKQINLHLRPGEKVAIVGSTGAGKSTLVSLLPRFYDPQCGRVTIDGVDIREFQLKSLRQQIAMVLQPPLVFPLTMGENIAYGRPEATLEEIIAAAQLACIHDFIAQLPQGYNTVVGEGGATLSEGQKQRLSIARAILRDAPILILDEPTSSLEKLWEQTLRLHGCQVVRNSQTLQWKLSRDDYTITAVERDGEMVGLVASQQRGDRQWLVCDLLAADMGDSLRATLIAVTNVAHAQALIPERKKPIIKVAVLVTPVMEPVVSSLGFVRDAYDFPMVVHVLDSTLSKEDVNPRRWYVSGND